MSLFKDPKIQWLKRRVFGKNEPNKTLKWTCLILFGWSFLMLVLMAGLGSFAVFSPADSSRFQEYQELREMGISFFFPYACFHLVSLISIALIYRRKRFGVLLYGITCVACVVFPWIKGLGFPMESLVFNLICFGLFAVHLVAMRKKAEESNMEEEVIDRSEANQQ